jgi:hypothetical protein
MSINILTAIQENLGYPPLQKIDTATNQVVADDKTPEEEKFSQAAIPAILTAMYRYVQSDDGAAAILKNEAATDWISLIFDAKRKEAVETIAAYAGQPKKDSIAKMNAIAGEAVKIAKENLTGNAGIKEVKMFFFNQKNNILLYLLPGLHMGELLADDTLDDSTHKMEGPVSSLIAGIGAAFSTPVTDEEVK